MRQGTDHIANADNMAQIIVQRGTVEAVRGLLVCFNDEPSEPSRCVGSEKLSVFFEKALEIAT